MPTIFDKFYPNGFVKNTLKSTQGEGESPISNIDFPNGYILSPTGGGGAGGTFLELTDTPVSYLGSGGFGVRVNSGQTGLEFFDLTSLIEGIKYSWANDAARTAQTGMVAKELGVQRDTGNVYRYDGAVWSIFFNLQDGFFPSATQGSILYKGAINWSVLAPGSSGNVLTTQGPAANPVWAPAGGGGGKEFAPTVVVGNLQAGDTLSDCDYLHDNTLAATTDAIEDALTDARIANGGIIYVRGGTYLFPNRLKQYVVPSGVHIVGEGIGATIIQIAGNNHQRQIPMFYFNSVSRCSLRDFSLEWTASSWYSYANYFIQFNNADDCLMENIEIYATESKTFELIGSYPCLIQVGAGRRNSFKGLKVNCNGNIGYGECAVIHTWSLDTQIRDCQMVGMNSLPVLWVQGANTTIEGCNILNSTVDAGLDASGVLIDADQNVSLVTIDDNFFETGGICVELRAYSGEQSGNNINDVVISNNTMRPYRSSIRMKQDRTDPYTGTTIKNVVVEGNSILKPDYLSQLNPNNTPYCVEIDALSYTVVGNNLDMQNTKGTSLTRQAGIFVWNRPPLTYPNDYTVGGTIVGNKVSFGNGDPTHPTVYATAIKVLQEFSSITGNTVRMWNEGAVSDGYELYGIESTSNVTIANNVVLMEAVNSITYTSACIAVGQNNNSRTAIIGNRCYMLSESSGTGYALMIGGSGVVADAAITITGNSFEVKTTNPALKATVDAVIGCPNGLLANNLGVATGNALVTYAGPPAGNYFDTIAAANFVQSNNQQINTI